MCADEGGIRREVDEGLEDGRVDGEELLWFVARSGRASS